ncbi:MAG: 30S ribosomal protein S4 [Elusimicrobia bacterium]|nr:30S ribosomal protein S4 [Elusimicrobiota bacterium]
MSRYLGSVCKNCRREGEKLFLKGERCLTKCTLDRKRGKNAPGQHGARRVKESNYAHHLREKQKARRIYGLTEEQFRHYFHRAERMKGLTGENLLKLLELRLDNIVYRLGIALSRKLSRQLVGHGQILINNRRINLPGYQVKVGDKISLDEKLRENVFIKKALERSERFPSWLSFDKEKITGSILNLPGIDEFSHPIDSQLIVELYSK